MNLDLFSLREKEIFNTLKAIKDCDFVIIGGYAVNAYALPRFSVDCDIVVKDSGELLKIEGILLNNGYKKENLFNASYSGEFFRYGKKLNNNFAVSMDVLFSKVVDRLTSSVFSSEWIFENSSTKIFRGKTISQDLRLRIINLDALMVMKMVSCRSTDIRDVFMLSPFAKDKEWIVSEISARYDFNNRISKIIDNITAKQFKDGLSGVYGSFDQKVFEKHKNSLISFSK